MNPKLVSITYTYNIIEHKFTVFEMFFFMTSSQDSSTSINAGITNFSFAILSSLIDFSVNFKLFNKYFEYTKYPALSLPLNKFLHSFIRSGS